MVRKAIKFTPEVMLSAPRRSAGVPNPAGDAVAYTVSSYSFKTHKKDNILKVLDVKIGNTDDIIEDKDISGLGWVDDEHLLFLQGESDGSTSLRVASLSWDAGTGRGTHVKDIYTAGTIDGPASDLKVVPLDKNETEFAVVFAAQASQDGSLFNPSKSKPTRSTGRLYTNLFVRHWDSYKSEERNALFYAKLSKGSDGKLSLSKITNALEGTGLESPVPPFGGTDHFDICHNCIIFVAKDPDLDPALNTKSDVYILRIASWDEKASPVLERAVIRGFEGASTSPVLSPDGRKAAFLSMKQNGYEADRNEVFILESLDKSVQKAQRVFSSNTKDGKAWDRSPSSICFTADGENLLAVAEEYGSIKLFLLSASPAAPADVKPLTQTGSVLDVKPLVSGAAFISGTNLVDNSFFAIVDPIIPPERTQQSDSSISWSNSNSAQGGKFGLSYDQISSIWTPASNPKINKEVHSIVVKPSDFDSSKTYPVAYIIHGGPQGSWEDNWSTRWNLAIFAEQGYIVIAPNPTGSTGYGQEFTDSIKANWGGDPYQDIVNCFEWVGKNMPEADNDRAVALGASYGGYMMNWIQGHDLGRKMKAIVCHDGIFTMAGMLATEELYFPFRDIGGTPWYSPKESSKTNTVALQANDNFGAVTYSDWRRWDPSEHFTEWATPQLVIHSSKDYRICISDGLGAFNVLQARGIDSQFLTFPDENHWVLKPENSLAWHKVVLNWINKYAGLPPYTKEDPESPEFWGGVRSENEELADMMTQGKAEM